MGNDSPGDDGGGIQAQQLDDHGIGYNGVEDSDSDDDEAPDLIVLADDEEEKDDNDDDEGGQQDACIRAARAQKAAVETPAEANVDATTSTPIQQEGGHQHEQKQEDLPPPCPVTILSGFLGSGKSTLINYILKSPNHGKRIAVIENEFGDGLDVESMIARDGVEDSNNDDNDGSNKKGTLQDLIELPNGCICCTVKDSLVTTLEMLLTKRSDLDYILIEASGMANPGPIASVFWLDEELESRLKLDGIVSLVDAANIIRQLDETEEAAQQLAYADRILLNKIDLLSSAQAEEEEKEKGDREPGSSKPKHRQREIEEVIRSINPTAPILATRYSQVPELDWILDANCFGGSDRIEELESTFNNIDMDRGCGDSDEISHHCNECCDGHDHVHDHSHRNENGHQHTSSISTVALKEVGSVNLNKLNAWLADILWPNQDEKDEVLTAMLHGNTIIDTDDKKTDDLQEDSPHKSKQQIFRIKGIVSAMFDQDINLDLRDCQNDDNGQVSNRNEKYHDISTGLDQRRFIVQACHDLWEVHPASDDLKFQPDEQRTGEKGLRAMKKIFLSVSSPVAFLLFYHQPQ